MPAPNTAPPGRAMTMNAFTILARLYALPEHQGPGSAFQNGQTSGRFYPVLNTLLHEGLIETSPAGPRRHYRFTAAGEARFLAERQALLTLLAHPTDRSGDTAPSMPDQRSEQLRTLLLFLILPTGSREGHRPSLLLLGDPARSHILLAEARHALGRLPRTDGTPLQTDWNTRPYPKTRHDRDPDPRDRTPGTAHTRPDLQVDIWTDLDLLHPRHRPHGLSSPEREQLSAIMQGSTLHRRQIYVGETLDLRRLTPTERQVLQGRTDLLPLWPQSWAEHNQQLDAFWLGGGPLSADPHQQFRSFQAAGQVPVPRPWRRHDERPETRLALFHHLCSDT